MRYLGSKSLVVSQISELLEPYEQGLVFCDPFGGIGTVGSYMKQKGFGVVSGDLLLFAHYFQKSLIQLNDIPAFGGLDSLKDQSSGLEVFFNNIRVDSGWLIEEYSIKRQYFTLPNAENIQACIDTIWAWRANNQVNDDEYAFLIASLIQSMDKVANTAGTYYAHLKHYHRKALRPFRFQFLTPIKSKFSCKCYLEDANTLVDKHTCDVLYLDPPYNTRDYSRYYHLPETIAKGIVPEPIGKSGVPARCEAKSPYIIKSKVESAFLELLKKCHCKTLIFHYSDNGLLNKRFVKEVLSEFGNMEEFYFFCKGYHTTHAVTDSQHHVYKVVI